MGEGGVHLFILPVIQIIGPGTHIDQKASHWDPNRNRFTLPLACRESVKN